MCTSKQKNVQRDFFDEHNVHGHTYINRVRKLTKSFIFTSLAYKMESQNSNVNQRRKLLTFSLVIETYDGESITLVSVGAQKRPFSSRHWNHSCEFMIPNIDILLRILR